MISTIRQRLLLSESAWKRFSSTAIAAVAKNVSTKNSSKNNTNTKTSNTNTNTRTQTWILRVAKTIKFIRIPFLVLTVFGVGYNQGKIDYARDPEGEKKLLLAKVLAGIGATPADRLTSSSVGIGDARVHQVQRVGKRVTKVAAAHVKRQMQAQYEKCAQRLEDKGYKATEQNMTDMLREDKEATMWSTAERHMTTTGSAAGRMSSSSWEYYVIDSPIPNAFVSEILPHHIFITTAMMDTFIRNDDEMALILGHELSHLILGHVSKTNTLETFLRALEVLLLSVDPTEGAASLVMMVVYWATRTLIGAAHSQDHEREADELGIKIAAMACYDTKLASEVFDKIHKFDSESGANKALKGTAADWFDSHPPVMERYHYLVAESEIENKDKYFDDECYTVKGKLMKILNNNKKKRERERENSTASASIDTSKES
jgi:Zn-dependent protease with chaperone function